MEMPQLRESAESAAFHSCLESPVQKRPDFPTFPQALMPNLAIFKMKLKKNSLEINHNVLYINMLH